MKFPMVLKKSEYLYHVNREFVLNVIFQCGFIYTLSRKNDDVIELSLKTRELIDDQLIMNKIEYDIRKIGRNFNLDLKDETYILSYHDDEYFVLTCESWNGDIISLFDCRSIGDVDLDDQIWYKLENN